MTALFKIAAVLFAAISIQGCIVGTLIDATAETVEAGVEVTGAAVGGVVDAVTPDDDDDEDNNKDDND